MPIGNSGTIDEREHEQIDSELCYSPSLEAAVKLILGDPAFVGERETPSFKFIRAARIAQRQCSSRVSDSRDAYRGEEQHGPLALGPVGLGQIPDIVRTRIKKRSLAVHLQGGDKGVTLRTVAWSTWSSAQVGREVSVAARSSRGWPIVEPVANAGRN